MITEKQIAEYREMVAQRFPGVWARDAARKSFDAGIELGKLIMQLEISQYIAEEDASWEPSVESVQKEISALLAVKDE